MDLIKDKRFVKRLLKLMLPILVQELIISLISDISAMMLNPLVDPLVTVGVSYALQIGFIFKYLILSIAATTTIFVAQYYGRGDIDDAKKYYYCALRISIVFSLVFFLLSLSIPNQLLSLFTESDEVIEQGAIYLRIFSISFLFFNFSYINSSLLKNVHRAYFSTLTTAIALVVDISLLAVFLYVFKWGVIGAAIAIVITRGIECLFSFLFLHFKSPIHFNLKKIISFDTNVLKRFMRHFIPFASARVLWSIGSAMVSIIVARTYDNDMAYVVSLVSSYISLIHCISNSVAAAVGILIGQKLGVNQFDKARRNAKDAMVIMLIVGIINTLLLLLCIPICYAASGSNLNNELVRSYVWMVFVICAVQCIPQIFNCVSLSGLFLAGGNTITCTLFSIIPQWVFVIPLGFIGLYLFNWNSLTIIIVLYLEESIRSVFAFIHYRSNKWLKNVISKKAIVLEGKKVV